jgi:hypothetical protein
MGLIINSTEEQKITITGTTIDVPSVYGRLEFAGRADGKTLEISVATYASKEAFESGASALSTNVPMGNLTVEIKPDEVQGLETAHEYGKIAFENAGYEVIIDLN